MNHYPTFVGNIQLNPHHARRAFFVVAILKVVAVIFLLAVIAAMLLPAVSRSRPAARHTQCKNNLKQISIGIENYKSTYGEYPPAYTTDASGKRMHSWRSLILPFIDHQDVYKKIDFSKPWDAAENMAARESKVWSYVCPMSMGPAENTTYLANITANSILGVPESMQVKSSKPDETPSAVVIEVPFDLAIHWMSPEDSPSDFMKQMSEYKNLPHMDAVQVLLKNGTVSRFNPGTITEQERREMFGNPEQPQSEAPSASTDSGTAAIQRSSRAQAN